MNKTRNEAMEMWAWRMLLKVNRTEMKSNISVLNLLVEERKKKDSVMYYKIKKWKNGRSSPAEA